MRREKRGSDPTPSSQLYSILATDGRAVASHPYSLVLLSGNNAETHEHKRERQYIRKKKKIVKKVEKKKIRIRSTKLMSFTEIKFLKKSQKAIKISEFISPPYSKIKIIIKNRAWPSSFFVTSNYENIERGLFIQDT